MEAPQTMNDDFRALTPEEERLLELLVEYDEALEDGTCLPGATPTPPDLGPEMAELFENGQRVLELLAAIRDLAATDPPAFFDNAVQPANSTSWIDGFETVLRMLRNGGVDLPQRLGRFLVLRELGRGGHGLVLLAHDPILKRHVALKLPRPEALLSRSLRRRFLRKAQAAARLTHPNLVSVYEVGEIGPICYIASAYCAGPTLATWLQAQDEAVAPPLAARIIEQLALAISYAARTEHSASRFEAQQRALGAVGQGRARSRCCPAGTQCSLGLRAKNNRFRPGQAERGGRRGIVDAQRSPSGYACLHVT